MATVEFYAGSSGPLLVTTESDAVPRAGEHVSILKKTWLVDRVTWAVDQPNYPAHGPKVMRACVDLSEPPLAGAAA